MKSFLIQLVKDEHLSIPNTNTGSNEIQFKEEQMYTVNTYMLSSWNNAQITLNNNQSINIINSTEVTRKHTSIV